jgi:hypothetical protein
MPPTKEANPIPQKRMQFPDELKRKDPGLKFSETHS